MTVGPLEWVPAYSFIIPLRPKAPNLRHSRGLRASMTAIKTERDAAQLMTERALKGHRFKQPVHVTFLMHRRRLLDPFSITGALKNIQDGFCLGALPKLYSRSGKRIVGAWDGPGSQHTFVGEQQQTKGLECVEVTIKVQIQWPYADPATHVNPFVKNLRAGEERNDSFAPRARRLRPIPRA